MEPTDFEKLREADPELAACLLNFTDLMASRLLQKLEQGRTGWNAPSTSGWNASVCLVRADLKIVNSKLVDAANYLMFAQYISDRAFNEMKRKLQDD